MKNVGKKFEIAFKASIPDYCLIQRLNDAPQAFIRDKTTRFTPKSPCDFLIFDDKRQILLAIECKTTKYKSISFERMDLSEQPEKMIHKHQILGLKTFAQYEHVIAGFLLNFRDEENNIERTYFQNINDFLKMCNSINKSSCNELDLILNGAIKVQGIKKRINYQWDIDGLLQKMEMR